MQDRFLNDRNAAAAMVTAQGARCRPVSTVSYTGAAVTGRSTGRLHRQLRHHNRWQSRELNADDVDLNDHWQQASRARWIAEETVRRLIAAGPPEPGEVLTLAQYNTLMMQAYVYAGYANRVLGENMCEAVIDGGPIEPNAVFFTRAEAAFTAALG